MTAWSLTALTPTPDSPPAAVTRWLAIAAVSTLVLVWAERLGRRLLPIATLLDLSLVFPDRAPSRFRVALRTGTTHQLERRIADARSGRVGDTPAEAASRVIELVAAMRTHDRLTRGHLERVRAYTQMIAAELKLPEPELDRLRWAGLLHDIGKILVPTEILNKTSELTAEEYDVVKTHPEAGRGLVEPLVPWLGDAANAVWEHHEKWDGSGYPRGLAAGEISRAASIVAVADVYDVLTSARSYKDPIPASEARRELARCAGSHFDPEIVRAFLNISLGRLRRAAGPLSWLAQLGMFPTAALSSARAATTAAVLTGALGATTAVVGPRLLDPSAVVVRPDVVADVPPARDDSLWWADGPPGIDSAGTAGAGADGPSGVDATGSPSAPTPTGPSSGRADGPDTTLGGTPTGPGGASPVGAPSAGPASPGVTAPPAPSTVVPTPAAASTTTPSTTTPFTTTPSTTTPSSGDAAPTTSSATTAPPAADPPPAAPPPPTGTAPPPTGTTVPAPAAPPAPFGAPAAIPTTTVRVSPPDTSPGRVKQATTTLPGPAMTNPVRSEPRGNGNGPPQGGAPTTAATTTP